jgi:hypothetical protein
MEPVRVRLIVLLVVLTLLAMLVATGAGSPWPMPGN